MTAIDLAIVLTRGWTRVYTWRLPSTIAADRCAEIECDLWEMVHDHHAARGWRGAAALFRRLVDGLADDLAWRVEQGALDEQLLVRRAVAVMAAGVLVVALWSIPALFAGGIRNVDACAGQPPAPETTPDLRFELVKCTGAFFISRQ